MGNVYVRGEPLFDLDNKWTGGYALHETPACVSLIHAQRLTVYARQRLIDSGHVIPDTWTVEVEAVGDRNDTPLEREYCVLFRNAVGGMVGVQGIHLNSQGTPHIDHGLCIE